MLYKPKYSPLHEVVQLIANRLAVADRQNYANADAAIHGARIQLLKALFEGTVRAEGVSVYPTEPPAYEAPSIEYDQWSPIDRGVWLHERCEKEKDVYRLDTISVHWYDDYIDYFNNDGEWAEYINTKIRLVCDDIDREFPAVEKSADEIAIGAVPEHPVYRTGVAGRPSSRDRVREQMRRRASEGKLCDSLAEEARELSEWLTHSYPEAPRATPKALANGLRHEYLKLKRSANSSS